MRYVLTGAPGSGRTTLAEALAARGHAVTPEAATDVIAAGQAAGVDEPWAEPGFVDRVVDLQRERRLAAGDDGVRFLDRSALCSVALARHLGRPLGRESEREVAAVVADRGLAREVFVVRPLGFVTPTPARRIGYAESLRFERVHEQVYVEHGFTLVDVPAAAVDSRADLVLARIAEFERNP